MDILSFRLLGLTMLQWPVLIGYGVVFAVFVADLIWKRGRELEDIGAIVWAGMGMALHAVNALWQMGYILMHARTFNLLSSGYRLYTTGYVIALLLLGGILTKPFRKVDSGPHKVS